MVKKVLDMPFMAKSSILKVEYNSDKDCYIKIGKKVGEKWQWKPSKFSNVEIGEIIQFLDKKKSKLAFFHKWQDSSLSIHAGRKPDAKDKDKTVAIFKFGEYSKALTDGEQEVMKIVLSNVLVRKAIA